MDPLSALGLVANIFQVIQFGAKIIHIAKEIHESASGRAKYTEDLENIMQSINGLSGLLISPSNGSQTAEEKALFLLAQECRKLSNQITKLLRKSIPQDGNSKRQVLVSAIKHTWNASERKDLEDRLKICQNQLQLQLTFMASSDTKTRLLDLMNNTYGGEEKIRELEMHAKALRVGVNITSIDSNVLKQIKSLLNISEAAKEVIIQQHIRKSLAFPDMQQRSDVVSDAHQATFRWMLEDGWDGGTYEMITARTIFNQWLEYEYGIFHVTGKLGCGKSTLMKYLSQHQATRTKLDQWAGNKKLVFANFFFWRHGSSNQKSLYGLMRSLLHDILKACPELIPSIFPTRWDHLRSQPSLVNLEHIHFQPRDCYNAFEKLINNGQIFDTHRVCFFIDGLDEYEETPQDDYRAVVDLLKRWNLTSAGGVKLCVSSREYNVFENAFSERRLRLQDLTLRDRQHYVDDKLMEMRPPEKRKKLRDKIVERSDGIFLWLALVVKRLRECLEVDLTLSGFERELSFLPRELESLFEHLLASVPNSAAPYQIVSMMKKLESTKRELGLWRKRKGGRRVAFGLSLMACSFLDDYQQNRQFALQAAFRCANIRGSKRRNHLDQARKRLNHYCKGLIEVEQKHETYDYYLIYTHRSILDFFQKDRFKNEMEVHLRGWNVEDAISQLLLAELRTHNQLAAEAAGVDTLSILRHLRCKSKLDYPPFNFLDRLDIEIKGRLYPTDRGIYVGRHIGLWSHYWKLCSEIRLQAPDHIVLHAWAAAGELNYVKWKLDQNPAVVEETNSAVFLLMALLPKPDWCPKLDNSEIYTQERFLLMENILERNLVTRPVTTRPVWISIKSAPVLVRFWLDFLLVATYEYSEISLGSSPFKSFGRMLLGFLRAGADPRVLLWTEMGVFGREVPKASLGGRMYEFEMDLFDVSRHEVAYQLIINTERQISLQELVEFWQFEEKDKILSLIEQQTRVFDRNDRRVSILEDHIREGAQVVESKADNGGERGASLCHTPTISSPPTVEPHREPKLESEVEIEPVQSDQQLPHLEGVNRQPATVEQSLEADTSEPKSSLRNTEDEESPTSTIFTLQPTVIAPSYQQRRRRTITESKSEPQGSQEPEISIEQTPIPSQISRPLALDHSAGNLSRSSVDLGACNAFQGRSGQIISFLVGILVTLAFSRIREYFQP